MWVIFLSNANPYQVVILILYLSQIKVSPHLPTRLIPNVRMFQISINPIYLHTNWIKCNINVEKYFCWAKHYIHHNFLFLDWSKKHVDIQTWLNASPKNLFKIHCIFWPNKMWNLVLLPGKLGTLLFLQTLIVLLWMEIRYKLIHNWKSGFLKQAIVIKVRLVYLFSECFKLYTGLGGK